MVKQFYPPEVLAQDFSAQAIVFSKIMNVVEGIQFGSPEPFILKAGEAWIRWQATADTLIAVIVLAVSILAGLFAYRQITPDFRSRNGVERIILWILISSSTVAILTTVGIVLSVLFESIRFFQLIPPQDFLFGVE